MHGKKKGALRHLIHEIGAPALPNARYIKNYEGIMIRLSLCMITKNEEANIDRCLNSIKGLVNDIIIVDTGSTDRTIEIAKNHNANIFQHEIVPFSFSKARNISLQYAIGSWILHLDADEELSSESISIIENIIRTDNNEGHICSIDLLSNDGRNGLFKSIRLFKNNPDVRYYRDCHEEIYFSLNKLRYEFIESPIHILHHGYNTTDEILEQKAQRNLELLLIMYQDQQHWLTAYQIGQSYFALNNYRWGKKYLREALKHPAISNQFKIEINNILSHF